MDFSKLNYGEKIIEIENPLDGTPSGIKLTVVCQEDEAVRRIVRQFINEQNRYAARGKSVPDSVTEEFDTKLIQASITGWEWGKAATWNGEKPALNPKNLKDVLTNFPTFKRQVLEEIKEDKDFLQVSK